VISLGRTRQSLSWSYARPDRTYLQAIYNGEPGAFEKAAQNYQQSPEFDAAAQAQEQNTQTIGGRSR
jgi:hypothetical protein